MNNYFITLTDANGYKYTNVLNEHGYPATWDLDYIMGTRFSVFYAPIGNTTNSKILNLLHVYQLITTSEHLKIHTYRIKSFKTKEQKDNYKKQFLPSACFSGVFCKRNDQHLLQHSGLICIDIDNLGSDLEHIRAKINTLPQTVISFISPSGSGLKVVFLIDLNLSYSHKEQYLLIADILCKLYSLSSKHLDTSCSNVSRACFLPFDSDCFLNTHLKFL